MNKTANAELYPLGDSAIVACFGEGIDKDIHHQVRQLSQYLESYAFDGMIEYVPSYTSVTVYYDPSLLRYTEASTQLNHAIDAMEEQVAATSRVVEIPVCYGGDYGPDLEYVAEYSGLSPEAVIQTHSETVFDVYMIGFAPGFPYLGGMSPRIATPRRSSPRLEIPRGSIGIAGSQTGIYPIETPGGWQIIGRTPRTLFRADQNPPCLLKAGDQIRFVPVSETQYREWAEMESSS